MQEIIKVRSWKGFLRTIESVRKKYGRYQMQSGDGQSYEFSNRILFRGQRDAELKTSLEKKSERQFDVYNYLVLATQHVNEIESLTGQRWNIKRLPDLKKEIESGQNAHWVELSCYDYLVYLRHHGFPSPLLDWTESPHIAAYFAYLETSKSKDVVVFCFIDKTRSGKSIGGLAPMVYLLGPYVSTHKRHFAQKAWYTVATQWSESDKAHYFCRHESVFEKTDPTQDILIKIVLPANLRKEALKHLNDYNINHFTLFQSEDSLIKAIELKTFDLNDVEVCRADKKAGENL